MEIFLLLLDELDDAVATLCMLWSRLWGLLLSSGLFALSVLVAMYWPWLAGVGVLLLMSCWAGLSLLRLKPLLGFKTDT